jgi:chromosome segregation ATPase
MWKWVSAGLALVAIGLLVWGLNVQSDNDDLQAQVAQNEETGEEVAVAAKDVYADVSEELGSTSADLAETEEDLAATEKELAAAEKSAASAGEDAASAKQDVEQAETATEKAEAEAAQAKSEADQAKSEADAAESKATIAADCAKAYVGAFGALFEGESVKTQVPVVKEQLQGISASCKSALGGEA